MQKEETTPYLSKEDLIAFLKSKSDNIKKLVSVVKTCKSITLSTTLKGEYAIITARKKLTPNNQPQVEHWYYSHTVKVDKETAGKRNFLSIVTQQLLEGLFAAIDRITWYSGLKALSA